MKSLLLLGINDKMYLQYTFQYILTIKYRKFNTFQHVSSNRGMSQGSSFLFHEVMLWKVEFVTNQEITEAYFNNLWK